MVRKAFCMLLMCMGLAGPLFPRTQESAAGGFAKLRALSGDWEGTVAWTGKSASTVSAHYHVTGDGSAVVEDLSNGMTSVYHLDGADLPVTPRLRATSFGTDNSDTRFSFVDITNLRSPSDAHVSGLEIRFLEPDHINITSLLVASAVHSRAQTVTEPKFRTEIQTADNDPPRFTVTNLSDKSLTACTIAFALSTEGRPQMRMNWDALTQLRGSHGEPLVPLAPGTTMTLNLPHKIGAPLPDKVEIIAGIWDNGVTFGDPLWVKTLVDDRASLISAYEQAISLLQDGLSHDWTRSQYLSVLNSKPNSLPFQSLRSTLERGTSLDNPRSLRLAMQDLLAYFIKNLSRLRPP